MRISRHWARLLKPALKSPESCDVYAKEVTIIFNLPGMSSRKKNTAEEKKQNRVLFMVWWRGGPLDSSKGLELLLIRWFLSYML